MASERRVRIVVEMEPDAPLDYLDFLTAHIRSFRYIREARWEVVEDGWEARAEH